VNSRGGVSRISLFIFANNADKVCNLGSSVSLVLLICLKD